MLQRLLTLSPFLLFPLTPLLAQDAPALRTIAEEVVVTGSKFPQLADKSPQYVTVIDSATVARATDLGQLLNEQAGIVVNGAYANPGKDRSIFLRNGANQYTLILVDGQPLVDPSSLGGAVDLRLLSLRNVRRIEVLRGARSLLYGSDAVAGVINLITESTEDVPSDPVRFHLRAAAQRYATYEGSATVVGDVGIVSYRLGYDYFTTGGISEASAPLDSAVTFARDGAVRENFTGSLTIRPGEKLTIRPALRHARFDGDYDAGSFQDADNSYTNDLLLPSLAVDYAHDRLRLGGRYNFAATDRLFNDAAFGQSEFRGRAHQADVFANLAANAQLSLTAGVQLRQEELATNDTLEATNLAPYLQANYTLAERYLLEAGLRYNHHSAFGGQANWSLGASADIRPRWRMRLTAATAFQSPTLDQLGGPFGANPDLQPQVSTSIEAGTQVSSKSGKTTANLAVFQRNIRELIVYDFVLGYQNRDELRDRGVELEATARLHPRWTLSGNLTHVRGRLTSADALGTITETDEFFRRPRTSGFLGLTYAPTASPFTARLTGTYTGARPDVYFDAGFNRFEVDLDPYLIVNAYAEYKLLRNRQLTVFGEVRNLTDADFVEVTGFGVLGVTPRVGVAWGG